MSSVNMNILMAARNAILNQNNALQDIAKNVGLAAPGPTSGAKHKASLGFESTLQVRNKLLSAYQDIMNMQV